ncbi:MAG: biotin-dependent carboxyltransferase family protein [Actinobacteria bacterium]|nr:biotin-dependent carboxyltransferase family protein [Actinomycetota bacterium]NBT37678.1 biotin-dependent carboxyltransferase family protein [Actinomycetota bacterium]
MTTPHLVVERVGFTTVQDAGRPGWAHLGVPRSGAADRASSSLANRLLGNQPSAALFETSGGLRVRLHAPTTVVLTGADTEAYVDDRPLASCRPQRSAEGSVVRIERIRSGVRSYLAFTGGLSGQPLLGSLSHDTLSKIVPIGLYDGATINLGAMFDRSSTDDAARGARGIDVAPISLDTPLHPTALTHVRLSPGPHESWFDSEVLTSRDARWMVTTQSDRIAVRLSGHAVPRRRKGEVPSLALVRGAVQVPPSGELIVMLADHPTTGGYPIIGVMQPDDVDRLAQTPPDSAVRVQLQGKT